MRPPASSSGFCCELGSGRAGAAIGRCLGRVLACVGGFFSRMGWLNLWRLESDFLVNYLASYLASWCLAGLRLTNWLITSLGFRGRRLLAFDGRAQLRRQGGNRASRRIGRRRRNGGYSASARA